MFNTFHFDFNRLNAKKNTIKFVFINLHSMMLHKVKKIKKKNYGKRPKDHKLNDFSIYHSHSLRMADGAKSESILSVNLHVDSTHTNSVYSHVFLNYK